MEDLSNNTPDRLEENDWEKDFPMKETFEDCAGKQRTFQITCEFLPGTGYDLRAIEIEGEGLGYEFSAFSEQSPYAPLGDLRLKISRLLATRHITRRKGDGSFTCLHDTLRGRIAFGDWGPTFVVDGIPLSTGELMDIMMTHEGWQFRLTFVDPSEDVME